MFLRIFLLFAFCSLVFPIQSFAQDEPDIKARFLSAWEEYQRSLPTTVTLEKTDEKNIYDYETTLFPYKGKLIVNNVLVSHDLNYYDYRIDTQDILKGVAEVQLLDAGSKELYEKYSESYQLWHKSHYLLYDSNKHQWVSAAQFIEAQNVVQLPPNAVCPLSKGNFLFKLLKEIWPILLLIIFLVVFIIALTKAQKKQIGKYDLSMERQLTSLEIQKKSLELQMKIVKLLEQNGKR